LQVFGEFYWFRDPWQVVQLMFKSKNQVQDYDPGWTHQLHNTDQHCWPSECPANRLAMSSKRFS
jgi:hypothetical protein